MNQIEAIKRLTSLRAPAFGTRDAAALLDVTPANANVILSRLERHGLVTHLARGRWSIARTVSRFALPELLSAPDPAYVSLQSALFHHGLIEQVPAVIYAVTLGRTRRVANRIGVVSFHHMPPGLFSGFEISPDENAKIATREKALFDILYLAPARSRLFAHLPELDIPAGFRWGDVKRCIAQVRSVSRRTFLLRRLDEIRQIQRAAR